jgi:hypothetical protein
LCDHDQDPGQHFCLLLFILAAESLALFPMDPDQFLYVRCRMLNVGVEKETSIALLSLISLNTTATSEVALLD